MRSVFFWDFTQRR